MERSDYDMRIEQVAHLDSVLALPEEVPSVVQSVGGVITFEDPGGVVRPATIQAGTVLSFLNADAALIAAVDADPYFNVRAVGECDGTVDENGLCVPDDSTAHEDPCWDGNHYILCDQEPMALILTPTVAIASMRGVRGALVQPAERPRGRHGLRRPGVRELIEDATEVQARQRDERRFRRTRGDVVTTFTVHRVTGLLIGEEEESPRHWVRATRTWRRVRGGWVVAGMEHAAVDVDEQGHRWPSRSLTRVSNLRLR